MRSYKGICIAGRASSLHAAIIHYKDMYSIYGLCHYTVLNKVYIYKYRCYPSIMYM